MRLICRIFRIVILFLFAFITLTDDSYGQGSYGLAFSSHEVFQDKRTGLDLSPDKTLCFNDNFDLSFDLSFTPNRITYFGYIVRIIENDKRNIDLVYAAEKEEKHFNVIIGERLSRVAFDIEKKQLFHQWNNVRIKFDFDHDRLIVVSGSKSFSESGLHLKKGSCYKVLFGINSYKQFQTTDIPPMKLRDIRIVQNNSLKYNWPLNEESGTVAHETVAQNDASVLNPVWVAAMHRDWQSVQSLTVAGGASVAFNPQKEEVYIVAADSLYTYALSNGQWLNHAYAGDKPILNQGNQSVYNSFNSNLYYFFPDQHFVTSYSFNDHHWDKKFIAAPTTDFWHLNKFFSAQDSTLYFLGGYGHLVYKNEIQQYNLKTGNWNVIKGKGDFFMPRYLAALGSSAKGDTAYVLGGVGNSSGQQILNPKNMYDMMRFTVKDKTFKKLFELRVNGEDFAFANSLVIDDKTKTYYGLVYPQHKYNSTLQLIRGSLTKPAFDLVGSTIPYSFHDIHSFADLYYCPQSKLFVAVTLLRSESGQTKVSIFTLMGPPYGVEKQTAIVARSNVKWYVVAGVLVFILAGIWYVRSRSKRQTGLVTSAETAVPVTPLLVPAEIVEAQAPVTEIRPFNNAQFKNSILLFGDLQVFDAEGIDITKFFTPLIKELFLVILLYSIRWGRGLSSEKLNEILWFDKDAKSARNNRSVNIAKLKTLLDKMGHCQLSKDTGYWKIDIDYNHIYVDYNNYLSIVKDKKKLDIEKIKFLSAITQRGNFLSNIEYEWLDSFKSEISNEVIDTYLHFAHADSTQDQEFLIELANFIFYFDPVNEEAMVIKCKALAALGKHSLAKNAFENFMKEYKVIYGEEFHKDFHAVLE